MERYEKHNNEERTEKEENFLIYVQKGPCPHQHYWFLMVMWLQLTNQHHICNFYSMNGWEGQNKYLYTLSSEKK